MRAAVLFMDGAADGPWYLRWLKKKFSHCAVLLQQQPEGWILVEPRSNGCFIQYWPRSAADYFRWQSVISAVVWVDVPETRLPIAYPLLAPCSCVEAVKRIVGVRARWVLTPWQLFRHLKEDRR